MAADYLSHLSNEWIAFLQSLQHHLILNMQSFFASFASSITSSTSRSSSNSSASSKKESEIFDDSLPKKTIYLIRHAESEENVKMHGLLEVGNSLYGRRLPAKDDLSNSLKFIGGAAAGDIDSNVSPQGRQQINELFQILDADQKKNMNSIKNDVDIIGHSPLIRARETCYGAFGLDRNELPENVKELSCLEEATLWETAVKGRKNTVHKRIDELKQWIENRTDEKTIALVGHSEYFMIMLGISRAEKFWNCDVWKVDYQSGGRWTGLELKHRLDSSKPMGVM